MSALKFLFSTKGRITRTPFIWSILVSLAVTHGFILIASYFGFSTEFEPYGSILDTSGLFNWLLLWPVFTVTVKRLHDIKWPATIALFVFVPPISSSLVSYYLSVTYDPNTIPLGITITSALVSLLATYITCGLFVILALVKGTKGPNRYGPDPKGNGDTAEAAF